MESGLRNHLHDGERGAEERAFGGDGGHGSKSKSRVVHSLTLLCIAVELLRMRCLLCEYEQNVLV